MRVGGDRDGYVVTHSAHIDHRLVRMFLDQHAAQDCDHNPVLYARGGVLAAIPLPESAKRSRAYRPALRWRAARDSASISSAEHSMPAPARDRLAGGLAREP